MAVYKSSIARHPSAQSYSNLGSCQFSLGQYAAAAASFEKAVALEPQHFLHARNLGDAYRQVPSREASAHEAYSRSIRLCDAAIGVNPADARAHRTRASALAKIGRLRDARAAILRAFELDPQSASNAYEAAVIANIGADEEESVARLEQALRLGYTAESIRRDPEFSNLRKNGRLQSILSAARSEPR